MVNLVFGVGSNMFSIFSVGSFLMSVIMTIGFTLVDVASHLIVCCMALILLVVESAIILPGEVDPQPLSSISFLILTCVLAAAAAAALPLNCFNKFSAKDVDVIWVYGAPGCDCNGFVRQTFAELYGIPAF